ncbi:MAG: GC-type dockerin domain-anchored protein [Phycisphaerales bacterium]
MTTRRAAATIVLASATVSTPAAQPGFIEDFNGGLAGWSGGATESILPNSGLTGAGDPCMLVANTSFGQVATRNLSAPYTGDLIASGVTGMSLYVRDLGGTESMHIHVAVGYQNNFWLSVDGVDATPDEWRYLAVDFTDPSRWVRYRGAGDYEDALRHTTRIQIRHCPQTGDSVPADGVWDFAVDHITILPAAGGCSDADLAEPYGQLDFSDVVEFLTAFGSMDGAADLAPPIGQWDFSDVVAFLQLFAAGCP